MDRRNQTRKRKALDSQAPFNLQDLVKIWVRDLADGQTREVAMKNIIDHQDQIHDLALMMTRSFSTIVGLLEEIEDIVPFISPPTSPIGITPQQSQRVCHAVRLLTCVALHPDTMEAFLESHIIFHLKPLLNSVQKSEPFQNLRLASVALLEALARTEVPEVVQCFMGINLLSLLFPLFDYGCQGCKTGATYVLQRILSAPNGPAYVCGLDMRLLRTVMGMETMVLQIARSASVPLPLLENILAIYDLLCADVRGRDCVARHLPVPMVNGSIRSMLGQGSSAHRSYCQLMDKLQSSHS